MTVPPDGVDASRNPCRTRRRICAADADLLIAQKPCGRTSGHLATLQGQRSIANQTVVDASQECNKTQLHLKTLEEEIHDLENMPARTEQISRIQRLRHDRAKLPLAWRDKKTNEELRTRYESPAAVSREIERIEHKIEIKQQEGIPMSPCRLARQAQEDHKDQSAEQQRRSLEKPTCAPPLPAMLGKGTLTCCAPQYAITAAT